MTTTIAAAEEDEDELAVDELRRGNRRRAAKRLSSIGALVATASLPIMLYGMSLIPGRGMRAPSSRRS